MPEHERLYSKARGKARGKAGGKAGGKARGKAGGKAGATTGKGQSHPGEEYPCTFAGKEGVLPSALAFAGAVP
jgi:hypothetical protein